MRCRRLLGRRKYTKPLGPTSIGVDLPAGDHVHWALVVALLLASPARALVSVPAFRSHLPSVSWRPTRIDPLQTLTLLLDSRQSSTFGTESRCRCPETSRPRITRIGRRLDIREWTSNRVRAEPGHIDRQRVDCRTGLRSIVGPPTPRANTCGPITRGTSSGTREKRQSSPFRY